MPTPLLSSRRPRAEPQPLPPPAAALSTSEIGRLAGVTRGQLRLYEREGLLAPGTRNAAGYRAYDHDDVQRLAAIRALEDLGFSLARIAELMGERDQARLTPAQIRRMAARLLEDMDQRLAHLAVVRGYVAQVAAGDTSAIDDPDCRFLLDFLAAGTASPGADG